MLTYRRADSNLEIKNENSNSPDQKISDDISELYDEVNELQDEVMRLSDENVQSLNTIFNMCCSES